MMHKLHTILSWIFMPLTMPLVTLMCILYTPTVLDFSSHMNNLYFLDDNVKIYFIQAFGLFGLFFPILSLIILKVSKQIDSFELDEQKQRFMPIVLSGIYALMLLILLIKLNTQVYISRHILAIPTTGVAVAILTLILNRKWKVSLHASGSGMLLGCVLAYFMDQIPLNASSIYFACILSGIIISSRIYLKKHTNFELILGFFVGLSIAYLSDYSWINLIKL